MFHPTPPEFPTGVGMPPNPKKLYGNKKPPLHLLPLSGMIEQSLAHLDGDLKYGFENWNDLPVESMTYIGAAMRHLELYKYGERRTRDTNVSNLGGVMACCAILIDAELNGKLIDNTKHSKAACDLLHSMEDVVKQLQDMQKKREEAKAAEQARIDQTWADAPGDTGSLERCKGCLNCDCSRIGHCLGDTQAPPVKTDVQRYQECRACQTPLRCSKRLACCRHIDE